MGLLHQNKQDMGFADQPRNELSRISFMKPTSLASPGTTLAFFESLSVPLVQEVVLLADIGCAECQKRVADIMSRMSETESVTINVLEKKVTLTCKYSGVKVPTRQVAAHRNPLGKISMMKRIFRSSRSR